MPRIRQHCERTLIGSHVSRLEAACRGSARVLRRLPVPHWLARPALAVAIVVLLTPHVALAQTKLTIGYEVTAFGASVVGVSADTGGTAPFLRLRASSGAALRLGLQFPARQWLLEPSLELSVHGIEVDGGSLVVRSVSAAVDRFAFSLPASRTLHRFPGGAALRGSVGPELTVWNTSRTHLAIGAASGMTLAIPLGGSWEAEVRAALAISESPFIRADFDGAIIGNPRATVRRSLGTAVRFRFP